MTVLPGTDALAARRVVLVAIAATLASVALAAIPSIAFQVAIVLAASALLVAVVSVRLGKTLDAAFVVVALIYLVGPIGTLLRGLGLSTVALLVLAPAPFVVTALSMRPAARSHVAYLAPLAFMLTLAAVSLLWSPSPGYGLEKLGVWILSGILPAAFIVVLASAAPGERWGVIATAAVISGLMLVAVGQTSGLYPGQVTLYGDNPIWTARAAYIGAIVVLFGPFPWVAKAVATPIVVGAGLLTVALGPLVGFAAGFWFGVAEWLRGRERQTDRVGLGWVALAVLSGVGLVVVLADAFFGGNASILARVFVNDPNVTGRATFLDAALRQFASSPFLGVGIGGFASTGLIQYPHNLIAEFGAELGGIGLAAFATWTLIAFRGALGSPILVALLVTTFSFALFSGSVASNAEFWMCSALAVARIPVRARSSVPAAAPGAARSAGLAGTVRAVRR
jgi:O-antigen ligase